MKMQKDDNISSLKRNRDKEILPEGSVYDILSSNRFDLLGCYKKEITLQYLPYLVHISHSQTTPFSHLILPSIIQYEEVCSL